MNIVIRGHNDIEVEPKVRAYTEKKVKNLSHHFDGILDVRVDFSTTGRRLAESTKEVQITVHVNGHLLKAKEGASDTFAAVDLAVAKIDRQIVRHKEKLQGRKRAPGLGAVLANGGVKTARPATPAGPALPRARRFKAPTMTSEEAVDAFADGDPFLVYIEEESGQLRLLHRTGTGRLALLDLGQ